MYDVGGLRQAIILFAVVLVAAGFVWLALAVAMALGVVGGSASTALLRGIGGLVAGGCLIAVVRWADR